jgi:hypothetical protein
MNLAEEVSMSYVHIEAGLPTGAKFACAPSSVGWLHIAALCWTAEALTDGFIPKSQVYKLTNDHPRIVDAAIRFLTATQPGAQNPAWEKDAARDGYNIHDYADEKYGNPTRARHQAWVENGRRGGQASAQARAQGGGSARAQANGQAPAQPLTHTLTHTSPNGEVPRPDVEELCEFMQLMVAERAKKPEITKAWRDEARLLLDRDKRPFREALDVMTWAANDSFWRSNVLSIPTFRKQYDRLKLGMQRPHKNGVDERVRGLTGIDLPPISVVALLPRD